VVEQALSDVKVLDLTHHIAGPYCTKLMAIQGADIIKIEKPGEGDPTRRSGPFPNDEPHPEKSGLFLYLNTNKKSITLNLKSELGMKLFTELVRGVDILVENFRPGVMARLGLDYETLKKINPRLVMTSISNFGQTGPYRDFKATNLTSFAMGGIMYLTGESYRQPLKNAGSQAEYMGGGNSFAATMLAFYWAEETGIGQHVDVSLMECQAASLELFSASFQYTEVVPERRGNNWFFAWGLYPCKDGYAGVNCLWHTIPKLFNDAMKRSDLLEKCKDVGSMLVDNDYLMAEIIGWMGDFTPEELAQIGLETKIPIGYVATPKMLLESPQLEATEFWAEVDHPVAGRWKYPGAPFKMSETPCPIARAPLLGEHNEEIYCGRLGLAKEDMPLLRERNVI